MSSQSLQNEVVHFEIGWELVKRYYEFANKQPQILHRFYAEPSTFSHATEGEDDKPAHGLQDIRDRITAIGFENCKVLIRSVDAQPSADGGIIVQVVGEMCNREEARRKFAQTIFLAKQSTGYYVLNDIFRFLKDNSGIGECEDTEEPSIDEKPRASPVPEPIPEPIPEPVPEPVPELAPAPSPTQQPTPPESVRAFPLSKLRAKSRQTPAAVKPEPTPAGEPPAPLLAAPTVKPHSTSVPELATTPIVKPPPSAAPPIQQAETQPRPPPQQIPSQPKAQAKLDGAKPEDSNPVATREPRGVPEVQVTRTPSNAPVTPTRGHGQHFTYIAAQSTTSLQCFVRGVVETVTEQALKEAITSRFGPLRELQILRHKSCAFLEFENAESARRAIASSLSPARGGEDGVEIGTADGGNTRIYIEPRKPRSEGVVNRPRRGIGQGIGGDNDGRGAYGYRSRGYGGPRGRGSPRT